MGWAEYTVAQAGDGRSTRRREALQRRWLPPRKGRPLAPKGNRPAPLPTPPQPAALRVREVCECAGQAVLNLLS